jgi:hypothetical protein
MQHEVATDGHPAPRGIAGKGGLLRQQARGLQQVDEQGAQFVKDLLADGVEKVAQAGLRGGLPFPEAEETAPAGAVLTGQQPGQCSPTEVQFPAQADAQEEGDGVKGDLPLGTAGVVVGGQIVPQGGEVNQPQGHLEGGQGLQDGRIGQRCVAQVAIPGAVLTLGGRGHVVGNREAQGQSVLERFPGEGGDEVRVGGTLLDGGLFRVLVHEQYLRARWRAKKAW